MSFDPTVHHRRSIRLNGYDYAQNGAYFVTICTWQREYLFGNIVDGGMRLSDIGLLVEQCWRTIAAAQVQLDEFVVMPNHLHGILLLTGNNRQARVSDGTAPGSLGAIIQNFKSVSTRRVNNQRDNRGCPLWQRNYYERVIRNDAELGRAREYIVNNPMKWDLDRENPAIA